MRITKIKDISLVKGTCYHDLVIKSSKEIIMAALGIKPNYNRDHYKTTWDWNLLLDGKYPFTIYDMTYGDKVKKTDIHEFHIGFHDPSEKYFPIEELEKALEEIGLKMELSDVYLHVIKPLEYYLKGESEKAVEHLMNAGYSEEEAKKIIKY